MSDLTWRATKAIERGVDVLLVAHGASLLAMVTSFTSKDGDVPSFVRPFIAIVMIGLLFAILARLAAAITEISPVRLPDDAAARDWVAPLVLRLSVVGSLLMLLLALNNLRLLALP